MYRTLGTLVVLATVVAACGDDSDDSPSGVGAEQTADDTVPECDPEMDEAFSAWGEAGFSGSIAVSTGGELDCVAAYGSADEATDTPNTVETVFGIGSISKAFTAAGIFDLVDQGEISLDDRAGDLVSGLDGPVADATVEQLLLHTSGLTGTFAADHEPLERDAAIDGISGLEQAFEPGTDYLYSNAGYILLAVIIEEATGDYRNHMASLVLPLPDGNVAGGFWNGEPAAPDPRAVGYLEDGPTDQVGDFGGPHWALHGNGDLAMTTEDLAAWTHALFTGEIVSPESVETMTAASFDFGDGVWVTLAGWGLLDESLLGEPVFQTSGGGGDTGHNASAMWLPESERAIAVATNTPDVIAEDLLQAVGPALVAGETLPVPGPPVEDVDPADANDVAGGYELDSGGSFEVSADEGRLTIAATGSDAVELLFPPSGTYTAEDIAHHEDLVLALFAGETQEGREEIEALESDFGPIDNVELAGTVVSPEMRTYVTITSGGESETLWYALNDEGGIEAVDGPAEPTLLLGSAGDSYRPDDPTGTGPDVTVDFGDGRMTITGPDGTTDARSAG